MEYLAKYTVFIYYFVLRNFFEAQVQVNVFFYKNLWL